MISNFSEKLQYSQNRYMENKCNMTDFRHYMGRWSDYVVTFVSVQMCMLTSLADWKTDEQSIVGKQPGILFHGVVVQISS